MGGFNGAWLDRHGIRPSYLGLGGPLLLGLGVRPPRSVSHLYPLLTLMLRVLRCWTLWHTGAPGKDTHGTPVPDREGRGWPDITSTVRRPTNDKTGLELNVLSQTGAVRHL